MSRNKALITGAASGLGLEFCRLLAADGHHLVMVDKDREGLDQASRLINDSYGTSTELVVKDLGRDQSAAELFKEVSHNDFDILINNAGFGLFGFFSETDWNVEETMLHLHVLTVTHLTKLMLQKMIERGYGRIMNVSSLAAFQPCPTMSLYYASKAYMLHFSEAVANEAKGTGVSVTVLLPGIFNSGFASTCARNSGAGEREEKIVTTTVEHVARRALKGMMKGRIRVIPGFSNKLLSLTPRLLPRNFIMYILRRLQE
ncbi:MAG: SDR family oxidoreductase, partial [Bacteroidota bacterium]